MNFKEVMVEVARFMAISAALTLIMCGLKAVIAKNINPQ